MGTDRRAITVAAGGAWLVVGVVGIGWATKDYLGGDASYGVYSLALLAGAALTVTLAASLPARGRGLRAAGLAVAGLGVLTCVVAWAIVVWTVVLGAGLALLALSTVRPARLPIAVAAAGQLVAAAVMIGGTLAEIGPRDEWGDYPLAQALAMVVAASAALAGIALLDRTRARRAVGAVPVAGP